MGDKADASRPDLHPAGRRPDLRTAGRDHAIAEIARGQHGLVTAGQLAALGLGGRGVRHRVASGRLHRLHPGVFAVGHVSVTQQARWLAAVLAGGEGAVLSHLSAAALWRLRPAPLGAAVHVVVPRGRGARLTTVVVHRPRALDAADRTRRDGIAVTTVARTLVDLAGPLTGDELSRVVSEAEVSKLLDVAQVEDALARAPLSRGAARLRALVAEPVARTRSEMERRFLAFCRRRGLPRPETNQLLELPSFRLEVDALWRPQRLAVELDSTTFHLTRRAFEVDRVRDAALLRAGYAPLRVTWHRLHHQGDALLDDLRALLARPLGADPDAMRPR